MLSYQIIRPHNALLLKTISEIYKFKSRLLNSQGVYWVKLPNYGLLKLNNRRAFLRSASFIPETQKSFSELEEFKNVSKIVESYLTEDDGDPQLFDALSWCSEVFRYNLRSGKKNRGTAVVTAYKKLSKDCSASAISSACILGWCVEVLQAFFIIADDIMDESHLRRGELCWYKKPGVGLIAINDALLMQSGVYKILRKHFGNEDFYHKLVEAFLEISEKTIYGQCLDMLSNPINGKPNYQSYTMDKYKAIVEYKTSHYSFCLPVHLAMHLARIKDVKDFETTRKICLRLGLLFQIQDDYLDCYGDPKITGKQGTDIIQGKCSWLAVKFLECADKTLKTEWMNSYANADEKSIIKVMDYYEKMKMKEKYLQYEETLFSELKFMIYHDLKYKSEMQELFINLLNKIYKREK